MMKEIFVVLLSSEHYPKSIQLKIQIRNITSWLWKRAVYLFLCNMVIFINIGIHGNFRSKLEKLAVFKVRTCYMIWIFDGINFEWCPEDNPAKIFIALCSTDFLKQTYASYASLQTPILKRLFNYLSLKLSSVELLSTSILLQVKYNN